ncbi:hypothetical protein GCM10025868_15430 [Angustibacter aerolatus]|uniref:GH15-like domain-containing protein n=1 Tax=Angustibacter aerolatus TaxID=1162965 RepID=A0ABQ6JDR4_9ACTN|nr:hypothetical protein [Angustibacter aerolatus]GMA86293.1 hypothetical protein GCM10025868_15430 [Angustibacter aerolatus]
MPWASTRRPPSLAAAQRSWLAAGRLPGADGPYAGMVRDALLDLHTLTADDGAVVAGWPAHWRYVWPRDASFTAVAYARTGHWRDAADVLGFVQRLDTGVLQARYRPDGGGPRTRAACRPTAPAGCCGLRTTWWPAPRRPSARRCSRSLRPLVDRTSRAALTLTGGAGALPDPSPDYWEVPTTRVSLGTAAPLAVGLRAAARLQERLGDRALAGVLSARAAEARGQHPPLVRAHRLLAVPRRQRARRRRRVPHAALHDRRLARGPLVVAGRRARLAASGRRPGTGRGLEARRRGGRRRPRSPRGRPRRTATAPGPSRLLRWLDRHRTTVGALPEKVLADGAPAGPAPLAWTAAMTVLAVDALH